jgi:hypothetical protein
MNNAINIFKNMIAMGNDPKQVEKMILAQNPQLMALSNQIKESGLSPIDFAMKYAKQNNIPIQENALLNMCQQMQSMTPRN